MRRSPWSSFSGTSTSEGIVLGRLIHSTSESALFEAEASTVLLIDSKEPVQNVVNRFLEASFFNSGQIVRVRSAGVWESHGLAYAVTEPVERTLAEYLSQGPLAEDDTKELVDQIAIGLAYLHSENVVFCNLRPESVWRSGSSWKLGDFSQLRVAGQGDSRELRATLARRLDVPPEVYEGLVSPAWDVWSLGALLRRVLLPEPPQAEGTVSMPRGRQLRNAGLPAPFDGIARDCLEPDPNSRLTLEGVRSGLHETKPSPPTEIQAPRFGTVETGESLTSRFQALKSAKGMGLVGLAIVLVIGTLVFESGLFSRGEKRVPPEPIPIRVTEADRLRPPDSPKAALPPSNPQASRQIRLLLDQYVASTKARNMRANLDLYADSIDAFYSRQALTHDQLAAEKRRQFNAIGKVYRFSVDNVKVTRPGPETADIAFDKHWSFGDRTPNAGANRTELQLKYLQGAWKIVSEREAKVYWTRHGRIPSK